MASTDGLQSRIRRVGFGAERARPSPCERQSNAKHCNFTRPLLGCNGTYMHNGVPQMCKGEAVLGASPILHCTPRAEHNLLRRSFDIFFHFGSSRRVKRYAHQWRSTTVYGEAVYSHPRPPRYTPPRPVTPSHERTAPTCHEQSSSNLSWIVFLQYQYTRYSTKDNGTYSSGVARNN